MQATLEDIEALYKIQEIDLGITRMSKQLDELPQRQIILNARKKREAVLEKLSQIEALKKDANKRLTRINDEDASLVKKENGVQAAIEAAGNDFRNAEARTKELDGIFRRRNELDANRRSVEEEISKINALESQIRDALAELDSTEERATESFKKEGTALKQSISDANAAHAKLLSLISPEVAGLYEKISVRFDTVSIGKLEGSSCSVCRAKIEAGHLIDLMQQAPIGVCPQCKRILIIQQD